MDGQLADLVGKVERWKTWNGGLDGESGAAGQVRQMKKAGEAQGAKMGESEAKLGRMEEAKGGTVGKVAEQDQGAKMAKLEGDMREVEVRLGGEFYLREAVHICLRHAETRP
jgi:hypothetical protein